MNKLLVLSKNNCTGCTYTKNHLDDLGVSYDSANIQENVDLASLYEIMSVPVTILLDSDGKEIKRVAGFDKLKLDELISQL